MNEIIDDLVKETQESLKRAEHSVFVSLKYTRTVDVIKNLIDRYITTLTYCVDSLIEYLLEKRKIPEKPENLIDKTNLIYENFPDDELLLDGIDFLIFLRKVSRAEYGKCEEFRRHVTMSVKIDGAEYEVDIDILMEAFQSMKKYVERTKRIVQEIKNED